MPQRVAAKKLGLLPSNFCKIFKKGTNGKKWPYRRISKIERILYLLLRNSGRNCKVEEKMLYEIQKLIEEREELLHPIYIIIPNKSFV